MVWRETTAFSYSFFRKASEVAAANRRAPKVTVTRNGSHYLGRCARIGVTGGDFVFCVRYLLVLSARQRSVFSPRRPSCASAAQAALDLLRGRALSFSSRL